MHADKKAELFYEDIIEELTGKVIELGEMQECCYNHTMTEEDAHIFYMLHVDGTKRERYDYNPDIMDVNYVLDQHYYEHVYKLIDIIDEINESFGHGYTRITTHDLQDLRRKLNSKVSDGLDLYHSIKSYIPDIDLHYLNKLDELLQENKQYKSKVKGML